MKRVIIIIAAILLVLAAAGGAYFWYVIQQPLYEPGMVRAEENLRASLTPPAQLNLKRNWCLLLLRHSALHSR